MRQQPSNASVPITFNPHPALYRVGSEPAPKPPAPSSPYERLKQLDMQLDRGEETLAEGRRLYGQTLKEFAILCHQLWKEEKAQGSRQGKGFRSRLQKTGIKVGRAYRAMKKFFPADFPQSKTKNPKALTSSAANEVGFRFTRRLHQGREVLQCTFALTSEEKDEFEKCLKVLDGSEVQRLFLEAMRQAAVSKSADTDQPHSEIANKDRGCDGVSLDGKVSISARSNANNTPELPSLSSAEGPGVPCVNASLSPALELPAGSRRLATQKQEIARNSAPCNGVSLVGERVALSPVPTSSAANKDDYNRPPEAPAKGQELKANGLV